MAKVRGNNPSKNMWFLGKVFGSRPSIIGFTEFHISYSEEDVEGLKEWVPEKFVCPPINQDTLAPASSLTAGTLALAWRRKPGAQIGWWYSVKVLRYLNDVPGAFVQWMDFPFPDSIVEAAQVYPLPSKAAPAVSTGVKRSLEDESDSSSKKEKMS